MPWYYIVIGYVYSVVFGHFLVKWNVDALYAREGIGKQDLETWHPAFVGAVERALYTASLQIGMPGFIAVWLAVKTVPQWRGWSEQAKFGEKSMEGRTVYNIFLIGSALSLAYGVAGAKIIEWLTDNRAAVAIALGLAIVGASLLCILITKCWKHHGAP